MADNDKTIANLAKLAIGQQFEKEDYKYDLYLVSHPLNRLSSTPTDYITYNISLEDLAALVVSTSYDQLLPRVSSDLSLGELAHCNALSTTDQAGYQVIRLDQNVDATSYGPLALPTSKQKSLKTIPALCSNLGFNDLAFKAEVELELSALAHKSYITSADVATGAKFPSAQIDVPFKNLCLSDESMLKLSALAHQDIVQPWQIDNGLSMQQIVSGDQPGSWKPVLDVNYLSAATERTRGSIAVGFADNNLRRQYGVKIDENDNAYVNVPWTNTETKFTYQLSASNVSANTLVLTQHKQSIVDGNYSDISTTTTAIKLKPVIENNLVKRGNDEIISPHVALFVGKNEISCGAALDSNGANKMYRADGTFKEVPLASQQTAGLMSIEDYNYLHSLPTNLPVATSTVHGAIKIGYSETDMKRAVKLDSSQKAYVDLLKASDAVAGVIKTGASKANGRFPVKVDEFGNAYVQVVENSGGTGGGNDIFASILPMIYPIGAIYLTGAENCTVCPLEGIAGMHWVQINGRYLLASGTLASGETFGAGRNVDAGLPNHTHCYSFGFSSGSSTSGYPHHGSGSVCNHSSFSFSTGNASGSIYGASSTVRPKAYAVAVFQRVS